MRMLLASVFVLISVGAAVAQSPAPRNAPRPAQPYAADRVSGFVPPPPGSPYARLFPVPTPAIHSSDTAPRTGDLRSAELPPRDVICGTTMWRVDASRDPGILLPTQPPAVDARIRKVTPPVCSRPVEADAAKK